MTSVPTLVRERPTPVVPPAAPHGPFDVLLGPLGEIVTDWQLPEDQDRRYEG